MLTNELLVLNNWAHFQKELFYHILTLKTPRIKKGLLKSQADGKADDNCCDWQFKG